MAKVVRRKPPRHSKGFMEASSKSKVAMPKASNLKQEVRLGKCYGSYTTEQRDYWKMAQYAYELARTHPDTSRFVKPGLIAEIMTPRPGIWEEMEAIREAHLYPILSPGSQQRDGVIAIVTLRVSTNKDPICMVEIPDHQLGQLITCRQLGRPLRFGDIVALEYNEDQRLCAVWSLELPHMVLDLSTDHLVQYAHRVPVRGAPDQVAMAVADLFGAVMEPVTNYRGGLALSP